MLEINISLQTDDPSKLADLLTHITKEITDEDYRLRYDNDLQVDLEWVYMDEGKYNWSKHED